MVAVSKAARDGHPLGRGRRFGSWIEQGGFMTLIVIGVVLLAIIISVVGAFNKLVAFKNRYQNAFAQIEVQLKRRYDLIPNLVETVKGYMAHERETLEAVIAARNQAVSGLRAAAGDPGDPDAIRKLASAEGVLGGAMGRLLALAEAYPDLKANENMKQLTEELTSTENKVSFARQAFNDAVTAYNTYKQSFPAVIFAGMFGHTQDASLLEFDSAGHRGSSKSLVLPEPGRMSTRFFENQDAARVATPKCAGLSRSASQWWRSPRMLYMLAVLVTGVQQPDPLHARADRRSSFSGGSRICWSRSCSPPSPWSRVGASTRSPSCAAAALSSRRRSGGR